MVIQSKFETFHTSRSKETVERVKTSPFLAQKLASHGPPNWFVKNLNDCVKRWQKVNFRVLASLLTDI